VIPISEERVAVRLNPALDYGPGQVAVLREEVCGLLARLGADPRAPFAGIVQPGDTVVLKPNLVFDRVSDPRATLTNGWFIKAVCDLALDALAGRGRLIIADVPLQGARFERVIQQNQLDQVMLEYQREGAPVELRDLRQEFLEVGEDGIYRGLRPLSGDPLGYCVVNLGEASELEELGQYRSQFAVGDYDKDSTTTYHMSSARNEYLIPRTILSADVLINLPKFKTHKKSGITCALKNLVGTCGHKSYLPHFREGRPRNGGDEFAIDHPIKELQRNTIDRLKTTNALLYRSVRAVGRLVLRLVAAGSPSDLRRVMGGSWFGNDTLWRTILDLNKVARYVDKEGRLRETPQRRYLCVVDGVYGGENDGPILPSVRHDGVLMASRNPVLIDLVTCLLMGLDPEGIKQVRQAFEIQRFPLINRPYEDVMEHLRECIHHDSWPLPDLGYRLAEGWEGHVPRRRDLAGRAASTIDGGAD
jgi:uncharacterized protein (DUF362 family)